MPEIKDKNGMNIGLFTDSYSPNVNGVVTSVETLKKALEEKGHTVYVITVGQDAKTYNYDEEQKILRILRYYPLTYRIKYGYLCPSFR